MMLVDGAVNAVDIGSTVAPEGEGMMADQRDGEARRTPLSNVAVTKSRCSQHF